MIDELPGGKGGAWVLPSSSAPQLPLSAFYQPVLSGATTSNIKNSEVLTLSSYTLDIREKIFQVLEEESQQTPMMFPEGIKRAKGERVKIDKRVITLINAAPKELSVNEEEDTMEWICKWNFRDQKEKGQLRKDQELRMGDVLNPQASNGIIGRDEGGKYQVGNIWEGTHLALSPAWRCA